MTSPTTRPEGARGFSLVELLVAMTITLIISGAIYGLLGGGQSRFRQEPELTDRQQNIRVAMDLIQRDLMNAGMPIRPFFQVFSPTTDAATTIGEVDGAGVPGPSALAANGYFDNGHLDDGGGDEAATDILEFLAADSGCPRVPVYRNGTNLNSYTGAIPNCYRVPGPAIILFGDQPSKWGWVHNLPSGDRFNIPTGQQTPPRPSDIENPATQSLNGATGVISAALIRYQIDACPNEAVPVPCLWRSEVGGRNLAYGFTAPSAVGGDLLWTMVARGIEDLQVVYITPDGTAANNPPAVVAGDYDTLVSEVRVTLTARAMGNLMQGATDAVNNAFPRAVRARLTTVATMRGTLSALSTIPAGDPDIALLHR